MMKNKLNFFRRKKMEIEWSLKKMNINDLEEYEHNPRILTEQRLKQLEESIKNWIKASR